MAADWVPSNWPAQSRVAQGMMYGLRAGYCPGIYKPVQEGVCEMNKALLASAINIIIKGFKPIPVAARGRVLGGGSERRGGGGDAHSPH